jgi:S-DNA-T family DNA segregation ATPase FtsK/SpoIIIE
MPVGTNRTLRVRCESATKHELKALNIEAGLYFAHRYAGLKRLFGSKVEWDVGQLLSFKKLVSEWRAGRRVKLNSSTAKAALQLKFVVELNTMVGPHAAPPCSTQLVWRYDPSCVASQLADDWDRLSAKPFTACRTSRELTGDGTIDIANVKTFMPAYDRDRGSFVPAYKRDRDLAINWRAHLKDCVDQLYLSSQSAAQLEAAFAKFETAYAAAIDAFPEKGGGAPELLDQATAYAELLNATLTLAKGDRNRDKLLKPVIDIGTVPIDGGTPAAVVAPWHPLRLAAIWRKSKLAAELINQLLATETPEGDTKLFFRDLEQDFKHPLYPELTTIWTSDGNQLLSFSDALADYSLHELPVIETNVHNDTNESPTEGSTCVLDLVRRYLALHPHERANMSVVLFNCDSARLPQAVVEKIATIHDDDEDVRCQVLLRHIDGQKLREVYRSILDADTTADAYSASEATQDFMARLRISVIADQAPPPNPKDGCPYDIVFSQDVISRHAQLEWYLENAEPADIRTLLPSRWSRRRPAARDDLKSAVFLCCPVQSTEGWSYLTALATFFKGDWDGVTSKRYLPVRQLDFRDGRTNRIFEETHDLGNWVVNFDELLDRRQLLNQQVRVIRYKQMTTQGRALIISSRASLTLLRSMILHRLKALHLDIDEIAVSQLADRLIDDANDMSGDIVLRAATRGQSASELIGIVLSRRILLDELGVDQPIGWYFLDDYAGWIGQKEQQIADLLAIQPRTDSDGKLRITLAVSEAKYIEVDALASKRKESQKQLRDTLDRLEDAVFGNPERLDRQSWLARIADLMLDGIRIPAASGIDIGEWRRAMREGRCEIELRGVSHVFVPTAGDGGDVTEATEVAGAHNAYQEVFGRKAVKQLLLAYWRNETTAGVRHGLGFDHMDKEPLWRAPGSGLFATPPQRRPGNRPVTAAGNPAEPAQTAESFPVEAQPQTTTADAVNKTDPTLAPTGLTAASHADTRWAYPSIPSLLPQASSPSANDADTEWLAQTTSAAKSALQQLQLQAKVLGSALTPNSALLRFAGSANMTIDLVIKKRSELLTTFGLNVISVRPEPGAVVIAIERERRQIIDIRSLWARWRPAIGTWGNQELLIGVKENDGALLFLSPAKDHAPHTLIAGSTGSGKSVLMQAIILAIAATNTPEQARIILIDPKQGVDYFSFDGLPHLDGNLIDDQVHATNRLEQLVAEMDRRYGLFREARVPNLAAYNVKVDPRERLPVIWLIHDEFAEWMLTEDYKEAVSSIVQRLGVKARAAGIYLVFAAQRPDASVMPMQLRANLGNRLILRVDSEGTSEIALGEKGAERLLGKGHLLAKLEGEQRLIYAQVPMVETEFADAIVAATLTRAREPA